MKRALLAVAALALLVLAPSHAAGPPAEVNVEFSEYRPSQLDLLPGESVNWTNVSLRTHTVTSSDGLFDSGPLNTNDHFSFHFDSVGTYRYFCTIHPSITGEVDVRRVILDTLPPAAVPIGTRVDFTGRTADASQPVTIQRVDGASATTVATVTPAPDGSWKTSLNASTSGDYRAAVGPDVSETRRLLVAARHVTVRPTKAGVAVTVSPSAPYSKFLVEVYERERFGWWPVARGSVDYVSRAEVRLKRPARVRIVLVDKDDWTPIAVSRVVTLPR